MDYWDVHCNYIINCAQTNNVNFPYIMPSRPSDEVLSHLWKFNYSFRDLIYPLEIKDINSIWDYTSFYRYNSRSPSTLFSNQIIQVWLCNWKGVYFPLTYINVRRSTNLSGGFPNGLEINHRDFVWICLDTRDRPRDALSLSRRDFLRWLHSRVPWIL